LGDDLSQIRGLLISSISFGILFLVFQNCSPDFPTGGTSEYSKNEVLEVGEIFIDASKSGQLQYGEKLTLKVLNPRNDYSYKWFFKNQAIFGFTHSSEFEITHFTVEDMGEYYVLVNNTHKSNIILPTVAHPRSCKEIKENNPANNVDKSYALNPNGDGSTIITVDCLMSERGGGWLMVNFQQSRTLYNGRASPSLTGAGNGIHPTNGPYSIDGDSGSSSHFYDFTLPYPVREFSLKNYVVRANSGPDHTSEIIGEQFQQTRWNQASRDTWGDISFGTSDQIGPTTSFGALRQNINCHDCLTLFLAPHVFDLGVNTRNFRIGWGESGPELEGWYPWYTGVILVR